MGSGAPAGRPKRGQAKITEADYPAIFDRKCQGASVHSLAAEYNVTWPAMQYHLQKCVARTDALLFRSLNEQLNELRLVRVAAWEAFKKSMRPHTHDEVSKEFDRAIADGVSPELIGRISKQTTRMQLRDGDPNWLAIIIAANDMEAKLLGRYEAGKREGQKPIGKGTYRAAGRSPKDTHEAMAQRFAEIFGLRREALTPAPQGMGSSVTDATISEVQSGQTPARQGMPLLPTLKNRFQSS